jgi:hypothetical protein
MQKVANPEYMEMAEFIATYGVTLPKEFSSLNCTVKVFRAKINSVFNSKIGGNEITAVVYNTLYELHERVGLFIGRSLVYTNCDSDWFGLLQTFNLI